MATLGLTVRDGGVVSPQHPDRDAISVLAEKVRLLPKEAPLVILIHGYKFHPDIARVNPHNLLYADTPARNNWKIVSWSRSLGFRPNGITDGLCIGFGWPARPTERLINALPPWGFGEVYDRAAHAGQVLGQTLRWLAEIAPDRRIDIFAHSLGARVAFRAVAEARTARIGRVILLGAAEYADAARDCLDTQVASGAAFFNVTSRQNDLFDLLFERFAPGRKGRSLGSGMDQAPQNWVDLQLDGAQTEGVLKRRHISLGHRGGRISHWGFYTRPGAMGLYRAILRERHNWTPDALRVELRDAPQDPRWARFRPVLPDHDADTGNVTSLREA